MSNIDNDPDDQPEYCNKDNSDDDMRVEIDEKDLEERDSEEIENKQKEEQLRIRQFEKSLQSSMENLDEEDYFEEGNENDQYDETQQQFEHQGGSKNKIYQSKNNQQQPYDFFRRKIIFCCLNILTLIFVYLVYILVIS